MPKDRITDVTDGSRRGEGHDIPHERVEHDDAVEVFEAAREAVGRARDDNGPTVLEVQVHRRMGHFMGDPQAYRPDEDVEAAQMRDSVERIAATMEDAGISAEDRDEIRSAAHERVDEAIARAKEQPKPDPATAYEDVFTNPPSGVTDSEPATDGGERQ